MFGVVTVVLELLEGLVLTLEFPVTVLVIFCLPLVFAVTESSGVEATEETVELLLTLTMVTPAAEVSPRRTVMRKREMKALKFIVDREGVYCFEFGIWIAYCIFRKEKDIYI